MREVIGRSMDGGGEVAMQLLRGDEQVRGLAIVDEQNRRTEDFAFELRAFEVVGYCY